jgi:hypothetical protein
MRCEGHLARIGEVRTAYKYLVEKLGNRLAIVGENFLPNSIDQFPSLS